MTKEEKLELLVVAIGALSNVMTACEDDFLPTDADKLVAATKEIWWLHGVLTGTK